MKTELREKISDFLGNINSAEEIYELFKLLNYPSDALLDSSFKRKLEEFGFKKELEGKVKNVYTVLNFEKNLVVFIVQTTGLETSLIRDLAKSFSDKYENVLLVVTPNYSTFNFVLPEFERTGTGKHKLKITKLFVQKNDVYYTATQVLSNIYYEGSETWREVYKKWKDAFSVKKVTEEFFEDYTKVFFDIREVLKRQGITQKDSHEFTLQLLNRIMFIYFVSKKGWLNGDYRFMRKYWDSYKSERGDGTAKPDSFYDVWLRNLFFKAFNNRQNDIMGLPESWKKIFYSFPYLNGGLFRENHLDALKVDLKDSIFNNIFSFFGKYNFTVKEDMPLDQEVAVDPAMIGYVYESLANVADEIYDRTDVGIYYTPKIEVDFMCRRSIVEYLSKNIPDMPKDKIYEFVFDENKENAEIYFSKHNLWRKVEETLNNLTVVDPACGSGAFLVGMMNVANELYKTVYRNLNKRIRPFDLKSSIVGRSLYGVDVMPWAVHAAELRLWLQLIIETDFSSEELRERALLPNLNLNLRVGDSLVQEIGKASINLKSKDLSAEIKRKLFNLKKEKENYYNNLPTRFGSREDILEEEIRIFEDIVDERISSLEADISKSQKELKSLEHGKQTDLTGKRVKVPEEEVNNLKEKVERTTAESEDLQKLKKNLKDAKQHPEKKPFVWEIDFAEIFGDKGGFDIVIGNPPYVRQEKISPPNKTKAEVTLEDRREYKEKLIQSVKSKFPVIDDLDKKSDYYIYFYFHGLSLLNEKGTFCFITSNSWLDVGYGKELQEFLLKYLPVIGIYDNPKRSFEHADINTIIALFGAPLLDEQNILGLKIQGNGKWSALPNVAKFLMLKKPFEEVLSAQNLIDIENIKVKAKREGITELVKNVVSTNDYRCFPIVQEDLLEDGWEYPENYKNGRFKAGSYEGNKWGGKYLRAPDIFYTILERGKDKVINLGRTTSKTQRNTLQNFGSITEVKENYSKNNNYPYLSSVKDIETIKVDIRSLPISIKRTTKKPIEYPTVDVISNRFLGERLFFIEGGNFVVSDTFFVGFLKKNYNKEDVVALLNSSLSLCLTEIIGRKNLGGGLLTIYGPEMKNLILLDPNKLSNNAKDKINLIYKKISKRPIKSIFEELGINPDKPIREQEPKPFSDRAELDKIIFDELELTKEERKEVYWAVCELVKQRLEKARSLRD